MLVVYRHFLGESHPAAGEGPEGVLGGRGGRVEGTRSESGAAREQAVIGEGVEGFSQCRRGVHDDLLQRVHRRGPRLHRGIPRDLQLAHHLDGTVRGLRDGRRLPRQYGPRGDLSREGLHWDGVQRGEICTRTGRVGSILVRENVQDELPGGVLAVRGSVFEDCGRPVHDMGFRLHAAGGTRTPVWAEHS